MRKDIICLILRDEQNNPKLDEKDTLLLKVEILFKF